MKFMTKFMVILWVSVLLPCLSHGDPYRDKHGNAANLTLFTPLVGTAVTSNIDYIVPYFATDSQGSKSGQYRITSQMLPGRDTGSLDFVLNVRVTDDPTQRAAELVIRNNPNVSPLAPILRLLNCSSGTCIEVKRIENEMWGVWVIQDQSDIATYPIELLDARVIIQLLDSGQLASLPNLPAGTGNWAEIMENHRTNFEEAKFRADIDHLGDTQSDLLTQRMMDEIVPNNFLIKHFPDITHHALTFLTEHTELIQEMTDVLHTNYTWPLNFTFPFGRMPIWLVDPDLNAGFSTFHVLPLHWDRVQPGFLALNNAGCFHDFPADGYVPTLTNAAINLGQYECADFNTPNGFVDRPCDQAADYGGINSDLEGSWHDPIHGFIGGSFGSAVTTSGTSVFWAFHTYASSNTLVNWRYAQKRNMPTPNSTVVPASLIDVYFLVDLSGSYNNDLPTFKTEVPMLIDDLDVAYTQIHFGLARFEDYPIAPFGAAGSGDRAYEQILDLAPGNATAVKNQIALLSVRYGADGPESQLPALYQTATGLGQTFAPPHGVADIPSGQQASFRTGAVKLILLFTDAEFHLPGDPGLPGDLVYPGQSFNDTVAAILALDPPMVIGISSGGGGIPDLEAMAMATGAVAPAGGADCDDDGTVDVLEGDPLVCTTTTTSEGIGDALEGVIEAAIVEARTKNTDGDAWPDLQDNCQDVANTDQADADNDGIGDVCDPDDDSDGIADTLDNCPLTSNNDQLDTDDDGLGNVCDLDDDDDGVLDLNDACPLLSTPNVIVGTVGNDFLTGTPRNDMILGLGGNDKINGLGGDDCLVGGPGRDHLRGGDGNDILLGGPGHDHLYGQMGTDTLSGDGGDDQLVGGEGDDTLDGGPGRDHLFGGDRRYFSLDVSGNDTLLGGEGDDHLQGGAGTDALYGGDGNDRLSGMRGDDSLLGGNGDDIVDGGKGDDSASGGNGNDRVNGGAGNDNLDGGAGEDVLHGGPGDDRLNGGFNAGDEEGEMDDCYGGPGTDTALNCERVVGISGGTCGDARPGRGYILSASADCSTDDTSFSSSDSLYMSIWNSSVDSSDMKKAEWQLRGAAKQNFTNHGNGTFSATYDLSTLPSVKSRWKWNGKLADRKKNRHKSKASIKVD